MNRLIPKLKVLVSLSLGMTLIHSAALGSPHPTRLSRLKAPTKVKDLSVDQVVDKMISDIESRHAMDLATRTEPLDVECAPTKDDWLRQVYRLNLVEASKSTALISDKLLQHRILTHYLGEQTNTYLLHAIGLKEFLLKYKLVDRKGELIPNTDNFEEALAQEFPSGFIVRPALGVAPFERNHGLFASNDDFLKEMFRPLNRLYQAKTLRQKIKSHIINAVASGEAIILQEDFVRSFHAKQKLKFKSYERVRIHTYANKVISSANPDLWMIKRNFAIDSAQIESIERYVQKFLDSLPLSFTTRQAFGVDVAVLDNGEMKIIELTTNRGRRAMWSSYLDEPKILGAYTRHFDTQFHIQFSGFSGVLFRNNLANYFQYWEMKKARSSQIAAIQTASLGGISNPSVDLSRWLVKFINSLPPWPF